MDDVKYIDGLVGDTVENEVVSVHREKAPTRLDLVAGRPQQWKFNKCIVRFDNGIRQALRGPFAVIGETRNNIDQVGFGFR